MRWNSFIESFGRNALGRTPNIFDRCERKRSEPPAAGGDQEQNNWYYNHKTASNFPAELFYLLLFRADVQRQFLIAKYSDANVSSPDLAGMKRFNSVSQDGFA